MAALSKYDALVAANNYFFLEGYNCRRIFAKSLPLVTFEATVAYQFAMHEPPLAMSRRHCFEGL